MTLPECSEDGYMHSSRCRYVHGFYCESCHTFFPKDSITYLRCELIGTLSMVIGNLCADYYRKGISVPATVLRLKEDMWRLSVERGVNSLSDEEVRRKVKLCRRFLRLYNLNDKSATVVLTA